VRSSCSHAHDSLSMWLVGEQFCHKFSLSFSLSFACSTDCLLLEAYIFCTFQFSLLRSEARRTKKRKLHKCQSFCLLQYDCGMWLVLFFDQLYFSHIFLIGQKANMSSFCERHDLFSYTSLYSPRSYIRFLNSTLILLAFASQSC